jgi:nucleoside-diphosphate-sugar epimerase
MNDVEHASKRHERILVTGAAGFVGTVLVNMLLSEGYSVNAFVHHRKATKFSQSDRLSIFYGDVRDVDSIIRALAQVDVIVHLAAAKSDERSSYQVNVEGAQNLVVACKSRSVRRIIELTTQASPEGVYGSTKRQAAQVLRTSGLDVTILAANLIYGDDQDGAFGRVIRYVKLLPVVPVTGAGRTRLWPIHVDDVCQAIVACLRRDRTIGETFVLAGRDGVTLDEFVDLASQRLGVRRRKLHIPLSLSLLVARIMVAIFPRPPISVSNVLGVNQEVEVDHDISGMVYELGIEPVRLDEGLTAALAGQR